MTLPAWAYKDPLQIVLEKEARSCKGCKRERLETAFGKVFVFCELPGKKHGKRCKSYEAR